MTAPEDLLPPVDYQFQVLPEGPTWLVREVAIDEELSGTFVADIDLESDDPLADPAALLGASATLTLVRAAADPAVRHWSGLVRGVREPCGLDLAGRKRCQVVVEPALARLGDERLTRKFQAMTVPDVARAILDDLAAATDRQVDLRLAREGEPASSARVFAVRELCVQYDETTLDFLRRILAEEGLTYFFEQDAARERLVIVDDNGSFEAVPEPLPLRPPGGHATARESVHHLALAHERRAQRSEVRAFDLTRHRLLVETRAPGSDGANTAELYLAQPGVTLFGYEGGAYRRDDAATVARLTLERSTTTACVGRGGGDVIGFRPGLVFTVEPGEADTAAPEGWYLLARVHHRGGNPARLGGSEEAAAPYRNEFTFVPADAPFRPPLLPKPIAVEDGAIVVSSIDGDPIDTDVHGRVRVWFDYDRDEGVPADRRSPWIPVAQAWAGAGYGVQIIPRAGMRVRLRYASGDPDRPFVAGCLPTAANPLPSPPPEEKARLTIRTRSLREGANDLRHFNEITLDDAAHHEQVFIRAGHNYRRKVLHDERIEVDHDERRVVGHDQALEVRGARAKTIGGDEVIVVQQGRAAVIQGDDTRAVDGRDTTIVERDQTISVGGERSTTIGGHEQASFQAGREEDVLGDDRLHVSGKLTTIADLEWRATQGPTELLMKDGYAQLKAGQTITLEVAGARLDMDAGGSALLACDKQISLVCGESSIVLAPDKIEIAGPEVLLSGTNASVKLDRTGATTMGLNVSSTATGTNEISGAFVKAN